MGMIEVVASALMTVGSACPAAAFSETPPIPPSHQRGAGRASAPSGDPLGEVWEVEEVACWRAIWTRRGDGRVWDAYWFHPNGERVRATVELWQQGRSVTMIRRHDRANIAATTGPSARIGGRSRGATPAPGSGRRCAGGRRSSGWSTRSRHCCAAPGNVTRGSRATHTLKGDACVHGRRGDVEPFRPGPRKASAAINMGATNRRPYALPGTVRPARGRIPAVSERSTPSRRRNMRWS